MCIFKMFAREVGESKSYKFANFCTFTHKFHTTLNEWYIFLIKKWHHFSVLTQADLFSTNSQMKWINKMYEWASDDGDDDNTHNKIKSANKNLIELRCVDNSYRKQNIHTLASRWDAYSVCIWLTIEFKRAMWGGRFNFISEINYFGKCNAHCRRLLANWYACANQLKCIALHCMSTTHNFYLFTLFRVYTLLLFLMGSHFSTSIHIRLDLCKEVCIVVSLLSNYRSVFFCRFV